MRAHRWRKVRTWLAVRLALGVVLLAAAISVAQPPPVAPTGTADLDRFLRELARDVEAGEGNWSASYRNARIFVFAQPAHDRMRVVAAVANAGELAAAELRRLLEANFASALDARFAISNGVLWTVFVHPLSSLTRAELESGMRQVVTLRANWGTTYASGELVFGDPG